MKKLVVCSNVRNEIVRAERWYNCFSQIADGGMVIVDTFSTDGTAEFFKEKGVIVVQSNIIRDEGYGVARNNLRDLARRYFPSSHWAAFFDADEDIDEKEFHTLRWIKDYLIPEYDVVAFPRIDWFDYEKTKANNDYRIAPDWQARMTRLDSPLKYIRKLHEQVTQYRAIYTNLVTPKLNHYHRAVEEKRDDIGKLCSKLHMEDTEYGSTYPENPKEKHYRELYLKEGL